MCTYIHKYIIGIRAHALNVTGLDSPASPATALPPVLQRSGAVSMEMLGVSGLGCLVVLGSFAASRIVGVGFRSTRVFGCFWGLGC